MVALQSAHDNINDLAHQGNLVVHANFYEEKLIVPEELHDLIWQVPGMTLDVRPGPSYIQDVDFGDVTEGYELYSETGEEALFAAEPFPTVLPATGRAANAPASYHSTVNATHEHSSDVERQSPDFPQTRPVPKDNFRRSGPQAQQGLENELQKRLAVGHTIVECNFSQSSAILRSTAAPARPRKYTIICPAAIAQC